MLPILCSDLITLTNTFRTALHNDDSQHIDLISNSDGTAFVILPSVERII